MPDLMTIPAESFRTDAALLRELHELATPSYEDPSALLARDAAHCDKLYLARDADGKLTCFFFAGWETVAVPAQEELPALYLGFSAARQDVKAGGHAGLLYHRCITAAYEWEREQRRKLILWGTTATPTVYRYVHAFLAEVEPRLDGSYSPSGAEFAQALRRKLAPQSGASAHPFVLKNVAHATRYARAEVERLDRITQTTAFSLFHELGVDEANGDRLLFLARTPDKLSFDPARQMNGKPQEAGAIR